VRHGFADIAGTLADWLNLSWTGAGKSFIPDISDIHDTVLAK
jgi:phosphopentomutase